MFPNKPVIKHVPHSLLSEICHKMFAYFNKQLTYFGAILYYHSISSIRNCEDYCPYSSELNLSGVQENMFLDCEEWCLLGCYAVWLL
jgi:hypothetical protein